MGTSPYMATASRRASSAERFVADNGTSGAAVLTEVHPAPQAPVDAKPFDPARYWDFFSATD